ncbi:MAG: FHA domain-containing protein, partial [Planctomycetes bacterium]|nr:FHA domain-containing protein [Planctomycetota bacterium]
MPILVIHEPEGGHRALHLRQEAFVIGRSREATVSIPDPTVSLRHALISPAHSGFQITDLGSQNGVYVNERRVKRISLRDGDAVRLGRVIITFVEGETDRGELTPELIRDLLDRRARPGPRRPTPAPPPPPAPPQPPRSYRIAASILRVLAFLILAAGLGYYFGQRSKPGLSPGVGRGSSAPGEPVGSGPAPGPSPAQQVPGSEAFVPALPLRPEGELARTVRARIVPALIRRCGALECHGGARGGGFAIEPGSPVEGGPLSRRERDALLAVQSFFDAARPEDSQLFRKVSGEIPHAGGAVKPSDPLLRDLREVLLDPRLPRLLRPAPPEIAEIVPASPAADRIGLRRLFCAALGRPPLPEEEERYLPMGEETRVEALLALDEAKAYLWRREVTGLAERLLAEAGGARALDVRERLGGMLSRRPARFDSIPGLLGESLEGRSLVEAAGAEPLVRALFLYALGRAPSSIERHDAEEMVRGERGGVLGRRGKGVADLVEILLASDEGMAYTRARLEAIYGGPASGDAGADPAPILIAVSRGGERHGPRDEIAWARSLGVDLLGRLPTPAEEAAAILAARALPGGVVGDLPIIRAIEGAVRAAPPESGAIAAWVEHAFARFLLRPPTAEERETFLAVIAAGGGVREARIALASTPEYRLLGALPAPVSREGAPAPCIVLACAAGAAPDLLADPRRFGGVRRLARGGTTLPSLRPASASPRAALAAALCGGDAAAEGPPAVATIFELLRRERGEEAWLVAPRAQGWESLASSSAESYGEAFGAAFWPADGASHPALRRLAEVFGRPDPLPPEAWARVRELRAALGSPLDPLDEDVAQAVASPRYTESAGRIASIIERIARERRPRLIVGVVTDTEVAPEDRDAGIRALTAIDGAVVRLAQAVRGEGGG